MDLIRVKDTVTSYLTKHQKCRESDTHLVACIWQHHMKKELEKPVDTITGFELLKILTEDKLPNYASIIRMRRKLQQANPLLRGSNYVQRKSEEEKIKNQLKGMTP